MCVHVMIKKIFRKYASLGRGLTIQQDRDIYIQQGEDSEFDKLSSDTLEPVTQQGIPINTKVTIKFLSITCPEPDVIVLAGPRHRLGICCVIIQHSSWYGHCHAVTRISG